MRVTTQMLHASAKRAGISLGGTSLLNYINNDSSQNSQNSLLNALSRQQNTTVNKTQSAAYKKLEETSSSLSEALEVFLEEGEEGIFQKEDKAELTDSVKHMLKKYNETVKALKNTSNPLNDFYGEMLKEAATESEEGLSAIGISQSKDGSLSLNTEKMEEAGIEKIKEVLDSNGLFTTKTAYIASRIADNAYTNRQSYSTQYGVDGYSYAMNSSRYDFWG